MRERPVLSAHRGHYARPIHSNEQTPPSLGQYSHTILLQSMPKRLSPDVSSQRIAYLLKTWGTYLGTPSLRVKLAIPQKRSSTWEESRSPKWLLLHLKGGRSYSVQT